MNFEFRIRNKAEVPVQRLLDKRQSIYVDQGQSDLPNYRSQSAKCTLENCSFRICFPPRLLLHSCWPLSPAEHSSQDAFLFTVTSILKNLSLKGIYLRICKRNNIIFPVDFLCIIFFKKSQQVNWKWPCNEKYIFFPWIKEFFLWLSQKAPILSRQH